MILRLVRSQAGGTPWAMPWTLSFRDESAARLGVLVCVSGIILRIFVACKERRGFEQCPMGTVSYALANVSLTPSVFSPHGFQPNFLQVLIDARRFLGCRASFPARILMIKTLSR